MSKYHIAATGVRAGQWVNCPAKNNCTLGGLHASSETLHATRLWKKENVGHNVNINNLTLADVEEFHALGPEEVQRREEAYRQLQREARDRNVRKRREKEERERQTRLAASKMSEVLKTNARNQEATRRKSSTMSGYGSIPLSPEAQARISERNRPRSVAEIMAERQAERRRPKSRDEINAILYRMDQEKEQRKAERQAKRDSIPPRYRGLKGLLRKGAEAIGSIKYTEMD